MRTLQDTYIKKQLAKEVNTTLVIEPLYTGDHCPKFQVKFRVVEEEADGPLEPKTCLAEMRGRLSHLPRRHEAQ